MEDADRSFRDQVPVNASQITLVQEYISSHRSSAYKTVQPHARSLARPCAGGLREAASPLELSAAPLALRASSGQGLNSDMQGVPFGRSEAGAALTSGILSCTSLKMPACRGDQRPRSLCRGSACRWGLCLACWAAVNPHRAWHPLKISVVLHAYFQVALCMLLRHEHCWMMPCCHHQRQEAFF